MSVRTGYQPTFINPDTGKPERPTADKRLEVWEYMFGDDIAMDRNGAVYFRDTELKEAHHHKVVWEKDTARFCERFARYARELRCNFDAPLSSVRPEITYIASKTPYNPIKNVLDRLEWDGRARLFTELADRIEWSVPDATDDKPLLDLVVAVIFLGGVERANESAEIPLVPVLYGEQGIGKTATIKALSRIGPSDDSEPYPLYCPIMPTKLRSGTDMRDYFTSLRIGSFITELREIDGLFENVDCTVIKAILDDSGSKYRGSYCREPTFHSYTDILIGTTNDIEFLTDPTGNRRYIPVRVEAVTTDISEGGLGWRLDLHPEIVQQLWAEAVALYNRGERWRDFYTNDVKTQQQVINDLHTNTDTNIEAVYALIHELLQDPRCESDSVAFSLVKTEFELRNPRAPRITGLFEKQIKLGASKHDLVVTKTKRHKWNGKRAPYNAIGFASIDAPLTFETE